MTSVSHWGMFGTPQKDFDEKLECLKRIEVYLERISSALKESKTSGETCIRVSTGF